LLFSISYNNINSVKQDSVQQDSSNESDNDKSANQDSAFSVETDNEG